MLVTDHADADRLDLLEYAKREGVTELMVPKDIRVVNSIPVLGAGKTDYVSVKAMVENPESDDG